MRKVLMLMLGVLVLCTQLLAQNRTVTGRITDAQGNAVANASVTVKGTRTGTVSGTDGNFSLNVPANATTLVVSSVGYGTQEVAINNRTNITVTLATGAAASLDEVVIVGYQQRRKKDEAGAISTIRAKEIENLPNVSVDKAMQGRAAGVLVQANNGIPGGAINVNIRGTGSFSASNQPLYVVDGVQINTSAAGGLTQSNPLAFLNPNDIESIDILKDAATAAIYGATASNGVVIITTKKGRAGKTKFQFNTYAGLASPLKKLDVTNAQEFYQLRAEAFANPANLSPNDITIKRRVLTEFRIPGANTFTDKQADSAIAALPTIDWQDAAFRNGTVQNYELSASGGNEKTTFRISGNFNNQSAIVTKADFKRYGLNLNLTNKATDRLTVTTGLNLSSFSQNLPFAVEGSFLGSPAFSASGILPFNRIYNPDGSFHGLPGNPGPDKNLVGVLNQNIIAVNEFNSGFQRNNQAVGNVSGDYKINSWLSFRSFYSLDYRQVQGKLFRDPRTPDGFNRKGIGFVENNTIANFLTNQVFMFNHDFTDKHHFDGVAGYEYRRDNRNQSSVTAENFPTFQFRTLRSAATTTSSFEDETGFRRQSVFASANYNYDGRYLIGGSLRYDGSSRFGAANRYGLFPGIKVGWNIDREAFMDPYSSTVSTLRLRAGYGGTGNDQIGNFDALGLYTGGPVYNGNAGMTFSQLENRNLRWETNNTTNIGLDFGFFRNRIAGAVEVYNKITSDLLIDQSVPFTSGFDAITSNVGSFQNKGIELTLGGTPIKAKRGGDFNWFTNFVFAYNKNKVISLFNGLQQLPGRTDVQVGQPLGVIFTQRYAGVNSATGRPMWYDSTGNLTYQVQDKDRVIIGDNRPEFTGGLTNTLTFKGFTLDVFFQYEYGRLVSDVQTNFLRENAGRINFLQEVFDNRWTTPGQITHLPRQHFAFTESKSSGPASGDRNFFKADYIRLKNVTLSYDVPSDLTRRLKMSQARFYVQGTNLYTYADARSYDVEFLGSGAGIIPQSKNVTVGLQLGF